MERALITGGLGLVGSHIADGLVEQGVAVVVLDDLSRGRSTNLAWAQDHGNVRVVEGDIRDCALVERLTEGVDVVFHQAALRITPLRGGAAARRRRPGRRYPQRSRGGGGAGVRKVVAASSASVYGMADRLPHAGDHHPYDNRTIYGAAKAFNEGLLRSFNAMYGLDYVTLRYFNVYGPRMDIHGVYTEVLIRWMERMAEGRRPYPGRRPADDGLRLRHRRRPGEPARGRVRGHRRGLQRRERRRGPASDSSRALLDVMDADHFDPRTAPRARSTT